MPTYNLTEHDDHYLLSLQKRVTHCRIGSGFEIMLWDGEDTAMISIGNPFVLAEGEQNVTFDPDENPTSLGPALRVIDEVVESARAYKNGRLVVNFVSGMTLSTEMHPQFESWQISGRTAMELLIVCAPGGWLEVWHN